MKLSQFIRDNQRELDDYIGSALGHSGTIDDDERENWVLNDESLYEWALREGVNDI